MIGGEDQGGPPQDRREAARAGARQEGGPGI